MDALHQFEIRHRKILRVLFTLILAIGLALRSYQYLMGRSLWEDEAHLALNFLTRGFRDILKPLDYIQAAPPLFLWTVESFSRVFGDNAMAYRALPFIASLLSLPLFYHILRVLSGSRIAALAGFLAFSVNVELIYYASELKTYGVDVAVYVLLLYLCLSTWPLVQKHRNLLLGLAGCLAILYSNVAGIILFCIGCLIVLNWFRLKKFNKAELIVLLSWGLVLGAYYFLFVHHHPYAEQQRQNYTFGFPPLPVFGPEFNQFIAKSGNEIGFQLLLLVSKKLGFAYVFGALLLTALASAIYKRKYEILFYACLPILVHFVLAMFRVYPFWYRLILYFVPALLILCSYGLRVVLDFAARGKMLPAGIVFAALSAWFFSENSIRSFPRYYREIRPVLDEINKTYPNATLYVTTPFTLYKFYQMIGQVRNGQYRGLEWNVTPARYYELVEGTTTNYVLLHAADHPVDGYGAVLDDLKKRGLVLRQFRHMTYALTEVRPLPASDKSSNISFEQFPAAPRFESEGRELLPIWNGAIESKPMALAKGRYVLAIRAYGTPLSGVYPLLSVLVNGEMIRQLSTTQSVSTQAVTFEHPTDSPVVIQLRLDNDSTNKESGEDRNVLIEAIRINRAD